MKKTIRNLSGIIFLGVMLFTVNGAMAQYKDASAITYTSTPAPITSDGTVSEFSPDTIVIKSPASTIPLSYSWSKTTTYVDENGNTVSSEMVKPGSTVTVYYTQDGARMIASKVVVRSTVTSNAPSAPVDVTRTSTTTTTVGTPSAQPPAADGVVTDAGSGHIDLRTSTLPTPIHYKAHDSTAYVDASGNPIPRRSLTKGTPVTIYYEQHGDDLFATRVVLRNPAVLDR